MMKRNAITAMLEHKAAKEMVHSSINKNEPLYNKNKISRASGVVIRSTKVLVTNRRDVPLVYPVRSSKKF